MKHLLNTLYITTQGAYLSKDGETVLVRVEEETRLRVPIHTLSGIICFGRVSCSPPLMGFCAENNVALSYLSEHGQFLARVQGPVNGNVLLRREQYRRADSPEQSAAVARTVIQAKLANCRTVLLRGMREHGKNAQIDEAVGRLARNIQLLENGVADCIDAVRGIEGDGARNYFCVFDHLITTAKEHFFFRERSRRPPLDNVNALLSFVYTLLVHDIVGALESVGLDPAVGFLHRDRPGRPGLALDLMEELRPVLADRLCLSMINRRQVHEDGFEKSEARGVSMDAPTRKEVLVAWQKRKQEEIQHPFLGERISFGLVPYVQALLLARYLRGDLDAYPAFFWR
ncbi:MAG TPA: type I-C CRISPR-associated endonuclease Cas1c [Candidatus Angelobacter sp.]|nr:type I-C CRISPR-associated endonuclease Cas1c [Candidatus Angelobacter sp.]